MKKNIFKHKFKILLFLILVLGLGVRLFAIRGNNFYFTMDQGRDAVYVRDILHGHHTLVGPHASIEGIFTGPLWYYFLSVGFLLSGGHPASGPILLIITQLLTIGILAIILKNYFGENKALLTSLIIFISPSFFENSIYAFNPFLLPILTLIIILALIKTSKNNLLFLLACLATGLVIHVQIASLFPLIATTLVYGIWLIYQKKLEWEYFVFGLFFMGLTLIPHVLWELQNDFSQLKAGFDSFQNSDTGVQVTSSNQISQFLISGQKHLKLLGKTLVPSNYLAGLALLFASLFSYIKQKEKQNLFIKNLGLIFFILLILSWLWFSISTGLSDWHLLGLPIIILLFFSIVIFSLPKKLKYLFVGILIIFQVFGLAERIFALEAEHNDQSMLSTELAAIDWIYSQSNSQGFEAYSYLPSIKDYPYQYLLWWRGNDKYDYLPCRYSVDKLGSSSYVPHADKYQKKNKECSGLVFLIIEPALHQNLQDDWHKRVSKNTQLIENKSFGKIKLEKRMRN